MSISTKLKEIIDSIISEEGTVCEACGEVHEGACGEDMDCVEDKGRKHWIINSNLIFKFTFE